MQLLLEKQDMAKQKANEAKKKKKIPAWQIYLPIGVIIVAVGAFFYLGTPAEAELDLSIIEQGANVVVQIHDPM